MMNDSLRDRDRDITTINHVAIAWRAREPVGDASIALDPTEGLVLGMLPEGLPLGTLSREKDAWRCRDAADVDIGAYVDLHGATRALLLAEVATIARAWDRADAKGMDKVRAQRTRRILDAAESAIRAHRAEHEGRIARALLEGWPCIA